MGNEVTLISAVGSEAAFKERWPSSQVKFFECEQPAFQNPEQAAYEKYRDVLKTFDVILDHTWQFWAMNSKTENDLKIIKVLHGLRPWGSKPPLDKPCLCGVSKFHRDYIKTVYQTDAEYAYNGIDLDLYPLKEEKEDYLVYLSRMSYYKGALQFIELCKNANMKGVLMGSDRYVEDPGFVMEVMRRCDGKQIQYMGEVSHDLKTHYLQSAKALISPLLNEYAEVFGLNIVEAMATGTPVIATKSGATPEVIKDSVTGFVVDSCVNIPTFLKKLDSISSKNCRKWVEENFTKELMAERYIELCKRVLDGNEW
jgi:glycosyltransferase involved in cell wall biosynthesis